jgi:pyrroline-5-carboxylate reductase
MVSGANNPYSVVIVGGGQMGEALLAGMAGGDEPLFEGGRIAVVERSPERISYLRDKYGVTGVDLVQAMRNADTILLTVKPQHVDTVLTRMADEVTDGHLVVSVVGGITTARIEQRLMAKVAVVRCSPNTPVSVGEGMAAISAGAYADAGHLDRVKVLFGSVGRVVEVPEEQLDAVTALSGSGPAYFFFLAEAMIEAGVLLGFSRELAEELVIQTAVGSAVMLRDSGRDPVALRAAVTSPGGTTISAIRELEKHAVRAAVMAAVEAARDRATAIGGH